MYNTTHILSLCLHSPVGYMCMIIVWEELKRYLDVDQVLPSYHNLVTCAALESVCKLELNKAMPSRLVYEDFARYGNFRRVRLAAFKCLANLLPLRPELLSTVLNLLETERMFMHALPCDRAIHLLYCL